MSQPQPHPDQNGDRPVTDSANSIFLVFDGPGDTTVRPLRPSLRKLRERRPPNEQPPATDKPS
jgi:hypothetical protein